MFGQKQKEIESLRATVLDLKSQTAQLDRENRQLAEKFETLKMAVQLAGPKNVSEAVSSLQYSKWRNDYGAESPAEDMKNWNSYV